MRLWLTHSLCLVSVAQAGRIVVDAARAPTADDWKVLDAKAELLHDPRGYSSSLLDAASTHRGLRWASDCILELMYRLSDFEVGVEDQDGVRSYSYERLQNCIASDGTGSVSASLDGEVDVDPWLDLNSSYFPPYSQQLPGYKQRLTIRDAFKARGLVRDSQAPKLMKQVNRLPFVEHFLRTGVPWSTSSPKGALQMLHMIAVTLPELGLPHISTMTRVADAGCGTGFVAALLALLSSKSTEVVCMEYEKWLNTVGKQIANRGGIYDHRAFSEGTDEQTTLGKISWMWADAVQMRDRSSGASLGKFDLIVFGMSFPHGSIPDTIANAVADGGVLIGPQCEPPPVGDYKTKGSDSQTLYCVGRFRIFHKRGGTLEEVPMDYIMPSFFMVPFD